MSKLYPECPLYNHNNCREFHNPKLCAVVKEDKICSRKKGNPKPKHKKKDGNALEELSVSGSVIVRY